MYTVKKTFHLVAGNFSLILNNYDGSEDVRAVFVTRSEAQQVADLLNNIHTVSAVEPA